MPKIIAEFEVTDEFIEHCQRIQKKYGMGPQHFLAEAIYFYQIECWSAIRSVTIDSPLQDRRICYTPKKKT